MDNIWLAFAQTGIWLVPLAILITLVALFGLSQYWRLASARDLKYLQRSMRLKTTTLANTYARLDGLESKGDPFTSNIAELDVSVENARSLLLSLRQQYVWCQKRLRKHNASGWRAFIGAPFLWGEWVITRRRVAEMKAGVEGLNEIILDIERRVQEIESLGWETALNARDMHEQLGHVVGLIDRIRDENLHGAELEKSVGLYQNVKDALDEIPEDFLAGERGEVLSRVSPEEIVYVYSILEENRSVVEDLKSTLRSWDERFRQASLKIENMRNRVRDAEDLLTEMPSNLDISEYELRLKSIHTVSEVLADTLRRMEIGTIDEVSARADELHKIAKEINNTLRQARRELYQLKPLLAHLKSGSAQITGMYAALGKSRMRPIVWDQSGNHLVDINRRIQQIGDFDKLRTPKEVHKDLMECKELSENFQEVEKHIRSLENQHRQLVEFLEGIEFKEGDRRIASLLGLSEMVIKYHQDNWVGIESVADFTREAIRLKSIFHKNILPGSNQPIRESQMGDVLKETREFVKGSQNLHRRAESLRERFAQLREVETSARGRHQQASGALRQISFLVRSNPFLQTIGEKPIEVWRNQFDKLGEEIDHPGEGSVESKARRIERSIEQVERICASWLDQLNQDIEDKKIQLSGKMDTLSEIVRLDDPIIEQAEYLLDQEVDEEIREAEEVDPVMDLNGLIEQLRLSNQYWQLLTAVMEELEDRVGKPLLEAYQEAKNQRENASHLAKQTTSIISVEAAWTPSTQNVRSVLEKYESLEEKWDLLKHESVTPIWGVKKLGEISAEYRSVGDRMQQAIRGNLQEVERIQNLESELDELARSWIHRERVVADQPDRVNEIHRLRLEMERERDRIKNQWLLGRRGDAEMTYDQVVRQLNSLIRLNRTRQISLAELWEDEQEGESDL